ncbi:MAG TPA: MraZ N-terminal domain-containing protein, partial [Paracoccaceae bacterium]|nr:MraZ N-terminal domain-containing protein [Paracoccaceae bacterium]
MGQRFRGEWRHKVDSKGRVSVPADFRRSLEEGDADNPTKSTPNFVLIYGLAENGYLEGYSMQGIDTLQSQIEELEYGLERDYLEDV